MAETPTITEYLATSVEPNQIKGKWWNCKDEEIYRYTIATIKAIEQNQNFRRTQNIRYARLYANMEMLGFGAGMYSRTASDNFINNRVTLNVIKSCIDTVTAKIAKNKPKPLFITNGGDWSKQRRAKLLTKYLEGLFECSNIYDNGQKAFVHGCVFGSGFIKIFKSDSDIKTEWILPDEIVVDDAEGQYGVPRQIHQRRYVFREVLMDMFPDKADAIKQAKTGHIADNSTFVIGDLVLVVESWHLKSGDKARDGKHVIAIESCTLFSEEYTKDYFPFVTFRWSPRLLGYYGAGLCEELIGIQLEINKILRNIQLSQHLMCVPRIWIDSASQINSQHINNEVGSIGKYTGNPPVVSTWPGMSPEVYAHLENLYRKAYEITGISQLSANSQKPSGLNAGVALREYQDIESERFMLIGQRYEKMYMDAAKIMIDMTKDLMDKDRNPSVKVKSKNFLDKIKWKDVNLEEDEYIMQLFPVSLLPSTPQGRLQKVQELIEAGFIDRDNALSLLDFPDVEAWQSLKTASLESIKLLIEEAIEKGNYHGVDLYDNLDQMQEMMQSAYLKYKVDGAPETRLELLRRYIDEIIELKQTTQQPQTPQIGGAETMQALGQPQTPPTSELMPLATAQQISPQ